MKKIAIIGGGPAGLMAAQSVLGHAHDVHIFEAMPSFGRKFLMAGKSGMNLTHSEDLEAFLSRYCDNQSRIRKSIQQFTPNDVQLWAKNLGVETFVGSSGRVFPTDFKAAPLLRTWIRQMKANGLKTHVRHKWVGGDTFETPEGVKTFKADVYIFAMGALSWPKLGSDGNWLKCFEDMNLTLAPFKPSNCGFEVDWSVAFRDQFAGAPLKSIAVDGRKGEFVISETGVEGSAVYTHSRQLREKLEKQNGATLIVDLLPDRQEAQILSALKKARGSKSWSTHVKGQTGLKGVKLALLRECLDKETYQSAEKLAASLKNLPIKLKATRPIEEAISCAGGVMFEQVDDHLMIRSRPGYFLAGEMLDWDAPTGGYLLTACFALGRQAGLGALAYLNTQ